MILEIADAKSGAEPGSSSRLQSLWRTALTACAALYGVAAGISTYPLWIRPAPADQLPGFMTNVMSLDAHASLRLFVSIVVLAICAAALAQPVIRRLILIDSASWPRAAAAAALLEPLWYVSIARDTLWTTLPSMAVLAACVTLRRLDLKITRADALLLPTFGAVYIALADLTTLPAYRLAVLALLIVVALRIATAVIGDARRLPPSLCFTFSPLALLLESHVLARADRRAGWPALIVALVPPLVMRLTMIDRATTRRRLNRLVALFVYPLAAAGYLSAAGMLAGELRPRVDFFEDAQHLAPSFAIVNGAVPYRDVVPPHGLLQDGLIDAALLAHGPMTIGRILKTRATLSCLIAVAVYALGVAATGSPHVAIAAFFAACMTGDISVGTGGLRFIPSVAALALAAFAVRRRSRKLLFVSGAATAIAVLTSIDFGIYAGFATTAAAIVPGRSWRDAGRSLGAAAFGFASVIAPAAVAMAAYGFLSPFVRVTAYELTALGPVYALTAFSPPDGFESGFPRILLTAFQADKLAYFVWTACLIALVTYAIERTQSGRPPRRSVAPLLVIAAWIVATSLSYIERQHVYFRFAVIPLLAGAAWLFLWQKRSRRRPVAIAVTALVAIILVNPTWHFAVVAMLRRANGPIEVGWREVGLPRAQGAYFNTPDAALIDTVNRYAETHLGPGDTFFDFSNHALLYFLLDRDLPVRFIEPAFYETEALQRETIARIATNPRIRFAIVPPDDPYAPGVIDTVTSRVRAPLVWKYLREHFEPDFAESGVELWRRK